MTRKSWIVTLGTAAALVSGGVALYLNGQMPKAQGFDPASVVMHPMNRATFRLGWTQKTSPLNYPVKYNQVRVYECPPPDGGLHTADAGITDGGLRQYRVTNACLVTDAGINWDAGRAACWCNRDGGVRDSGAPGIWDEKLPPDTTAHIIPCPTAPGTECPTNWFKQPCPQKDGGYCWTE